MTAVTLFVPGLLGPEFDFADDYIPELPALSLLLSKSRCCKHKRQSLYRSLYELCGFHTDAEFDIPVAAITRMIDVDEESDDIWMRADPVHLHADRDGVVMLDSASFKLTMHDALVLAGEIKESLESMGWRLEVPVSGRWYLCLDSEPDIKTVEPDRVIGHDIFDFMPAGEDVAAWHGLMNEVQMQMHMSEVNRLREQKTEAPVNSLWLWGTGRLPDPVEPRWDCIYGSCVFVRGLARLSATPCHDVPGSIDNIELNAEQDTQMLVYLAGLQQAVQYQDLQGWYDLLLHLEEHWFLPLLEYLRQGQVDSVCIHSGHRAYQAGSKRLLCFWKRHRPFGYFVSAGKRK